MKGVTYCLFLLFTKEKAIQFCNGRVVHTRACHVIIKQAYRLISSSVRFTPKLSDCFNNRGYNNGRFTAIFMEREYSERNFALPTAWDDFDLYPIQLKLIFDHEMHRTLFRLTDNKDSVLISRYIDEESDPLDEYSVSKHINSYSELKQLLESLFCISCGCNLPFGTDELDLETFVMLNRFTGFPRSFYDAITFVT